MTGECPPPLVPDEVDLTEFKFMPLEVARLLQSEWWIVACVEDPRRAIAAVNLWARSWHQRPAASVPDNDVVLSSMAMVPLSVWREIRDAVMEAWVLCSDGRWYHPVVAEKARESWGQKQEYQRRKAAFSAQQKARISKRWNKEDTGEDTTVDTTVDTGRITGGNTNERERKREKDRDLKSANALPPSAVADGGSDRVPKGEGYTPEFEAWWKLYPRKDEKGAAFRAFKTATKLVTVDRLMDGVRAYAAQKKADPTFIKHASTWLNGHCWNDEDAPSARKHPRGYTPMGIGG